MENKKKLKTTIKEVRKKMKKLTFAEKKQVKEEKQQQNQKEKKEANKQKITQRVRVNVNIPNSSAQPQSINFPNSFYNREQNTLLKSINEQLKQKNEPVASTQTFNIPEPRRTETETQTQPPRQVESETQTRQPRRTETETQTQPPRQVETETQTRQPRRTESETQTRQPRQVETETQTRQPRRTETETQYEQPNEETNLYDNSYEILQEELKNERLKLERRLRDSLPQQFSEKITPPPIIITPTTEKIPIVNKPIEKSGLTFLEQLKQKTEERSKEEDKTPEYVEVIEEDIKQGRTNPKYKKLTEEEKKQKAEEKRIINQENERLAEIEKRRKINEAENKKQRKEDKNKMITERALNALLLKVDFEEGKKLQEEYDTGSFKDKEIKAYFKKLKYSPEQIKRIFSTEE